ncbi:Cobalt-dependent inorganic pyrophosphatase [bioreactor metagenome]|jgi:Inorganic pyrophosphatase/exopolyphosphatase|uniref:inorganic diphosphatase n=1 Tax=bioreactor metagenome TaxID=1076179 RepID=A0A644WA89_9ZZZZ|nr:putative manganese-dependent inorganic diphosphatase [Acidaminococcaceae bacterium]
MKVNRPIYTIGHRNPDTDSICSAIGYAYLKRSLGENVEPARAGKINAETKYVLETFKMETPKLITDLYPRVKDVALDCKVVVKENDTLRTLGEIMRGNDFKSVPVVDENRKLIGILTVSDIAKRYFNELSMQNLVDANVTISSIATVIDGRVINKGNMNAKITGNVRIAAGSNNTIRKIIKKGDVVLVGDRNDEAMITCLNQNIACLVVTGSGEVPGAVLTVAARKKTIVITSPYDTYTCARLVNQCIPVNMIMQKNITSFKPTDMLSDIKEIMESTQFSNYPVVENDKLVGVVSRDKLIVPERERVILVDHNERSQAVEGIEAARIIEIIDHHRLGGIQTGEPIFMRQEPVGCTATIVANMYWRRNVEIPTNIAGLLLSAIISDTVLFKSPTCTSIDKETSEKLAQIADVDMMKHGMAVLKAGSGIGDMSPIEIAKNDLKEFQIGEYRMIVSQIFVMDTSEVLALKEELLNCMKNICKTEGYDMSLLMVTDIIAESTELLFTGKLKTIIAEAFGKTARGNIISLPGVMSRKKQVIPPMVEAAKKY